MGVGSILLPQIPYVLIYICDILIFVCCLEKWLILKLLFTDILCKMKLVFLYNKATLIFFLCCLSNRSRVKLLVHWLGDYEIICVKKKSLYFF
ncbi:hypothetical protein RIR_jg40177.t1 [Rhizophagus irregularis DAOM 181602=DAOM 197198]|nr:hypothetical protein RIR_jg40177.t1 [Rhizophagus irregularis DAOM 181602=DAOM 197198]